VSRPSLPIYAKTTQRNVAEILRSVFSSHKFTDKWTIHLRLYLYFQQLSVEKKFILFSVHYVEYKRAPTEKCTNGCVAFRMQGKII
jgi:hypothetical protein